MDEFTGGAPLDQAGLTAAQTLLAVEPAMLWTVIGVETAGMGFLADRRPKILFERHYFHRLTDGRYDASDPDISAPTSGGYGPAGAHQYQRLAAAIQLDRDAALRSASWGMGQIMGDNFGKAGFQSVADMVAAFVRGENAQFLGMAQFISGSPLRAALAGQDWATFARLYNGPDYAANHYDEHLQAAYQRLSEHGCPDIDVRTAQVYLTYLGYDTGGVDGVAGPKTTAAIAAFQQKAGLAPADGAITPATLQALAAA